MQTLSVLIVDANQSFLGFTVRYIEETYARYVCVVGAARPEEALALALTGKPALVLVGLSRPVVAALTLLAELRQNGVHHRIAMGQLGSAGYAGAALAAGATAFVDKDRLQTDLSPILHDLINRQICEREA